MQHLQSRAEFINSVGEGTSHHASRFHAHDGAQPLSACKYTVPHGLVDRDRVLRYRGQQSFQRRISGYAALFESVIKHEV